MNHAIAGIRIACTGAGIRYRGRDDLVVMELATGSVAAATFTQNAFAAAPVLLARKHLAIASPRLLLINAGNANAGTGAPGHDAALATCELAASEFACEPVEVLPFSTGVIGEPLPVTRFATALPGLAAVAEPGPEGWSRAARAIMTTDTVPKLASRELSLDGRAVRITGIAKGAGMICPDMATMLAFIATDAALTPAMAQVTLADCVEQSFNCISIDGDTSTNDACVLAATGQAGNKPLDLQAGDAGALAFRQALEAVCIELAQAIVRDGEGATKFVEIRVAGAHDVAEARRVASTVANSPLVKTALYASDPNWGRILAAVGRAGVDALDINGVRLSIGGQEVAVKGARSGSYNEAEVARRMRSDSFDIVIDLGRGMHAARMWTCDFSEDYVRINADYRT